MKKVFLFVAAMLLSGFTALCSAQVTSHSSNDANIDGTVDIADVNNVLNEMFGTATTIKQVVSVESLSSILNPYMVDNSQIVGTWYKTKSESITFNADGTTDYGQGCTYEFRPYQGTIIILDANDTPVKVWDVLRMGEGKMLLCKHGNQTFDQYTTTIPVQLVTSITLSKTTLTLTPNAYEQITATVSPSDADNPSVTWTSSNTSVAKVMDGIILAVGVGYCTITCSAADGSGVTATCSVTVLSETDFKNLLPGKFSVSATKQVQFTNGNLYWDGNTFKFEDNQVESSTGTNGATWNANHVSHFYWTNLTDYQSGNASYMPYAQSYSYSSQSTSDKFWCGEDNPLTVEGTSGLYALTGSGSGEWYYLINSRTNASSLYKYGVTVTNNGTSYTNCLIIAPDDFTGTLQSSYTLDEVNNLGLVCLPAAGRRSGSSLANGGSSGSYWSATPYSSDSDYAYYLYFSSSYVYPAGSSSGRSNGFSLRLVRGF